MKKDIRDTDLYKEAESIFKVLRQPGTGQISDVLEVNASPDGKRAVFAGVIVDKLEGALPTRICRTDLASGDTRVMTFGPNVDRLPKYSPDGRHIAFLSDRLQEGDFQLYLMDPETGAVRPTPIAEGWVEYFHWSPDGKRILLGVAGHGADVAGGQGAVTSKQVAQELPAWTPIVEAGDEEFRWRRAWVFDVAAGRTHQVSKPDINIWEAVWCGDDAIAAVASPEPGEGLWYSARLYVIDVDSGKSRELCAPQDQLGWPAASPSGKQLAIVEAVCSDRWIVAGDLRLIDVATKKARKIDTAGVDITYTEWRSDRLLLLAGHRAFETVVGTFDSSSGTFTEVWKSHDISMGGRYAMVSGIGKTGDCVLETRGFKQAPEIGVIHRGKYRTVRSFDMGFGAQAEVIQSVERVTWKAKDKLEIHGWLLRPKGKGPYPLVMNVHGGPVWQWRPWMLGAMGLMLARRGYVQFFPNPRGSSGRGQDFIRHVFGEMGGAETYDHLSGLDHLVKQGLADPKRLGVTGGSHGGYMTSWLITQDPRFAAAVPFSPVNNYVTERLIGNIPHFCDLFLHDRYNNPRGKYFERSPIMHAHKASTPTMNVCGALDRCTPPEEAVQFHSALLEHGVKSVLVTYPEEGHGVRMFPAAIDFAARTTGWFEEHMPAKSPDAAKGKSRKAAKSAA